MLRLRAKSNGLWVGNPLIRKAAYRLVVSRRHGADMADLEDQQLRSLFTRIGIIMEDNIPVALIWSASDGLAIAERPRILADANAEISALLDQIASNVR